MADETQEPEVHEVDVEAAPGVTVHHKFLGDAPESVAKFFHNGLEQIHILKREQA